MITFMYLREIQQKEKNSRSLQPLDPNFYQKVMELIESKKKQIQKDDLKAYIIIKEIENIKAITRYIFEKRERKIIDMAIKQLETGKKADLSALLPIEKEFFSQILNLLTNHRSNIFLFNNNIKNTASTGEEKGGEDEGKEKEIVEEERKDGEEKEEKEDKLKKEEEREVEKDVEEIKEGKEEVKQEKSIEGNKEGKYVKVKAIKDIPEFLAEDKQFYGPYFAGQEFMCPPKAAKVLVKSSYAEYKS